MLHKSRVGVVLEPAIIACFLADIKGINTTGKRVQANDNAHVVFFNGVRCDLLKVFLLVAVIQGQSRNLNLCCICSWDTECVDAYKWLENVEFHFTLGYNLNMPTAATLSTSSVVTKVRFSSYRTGPHWLPSVSQNVHASVALGACKFHQSWSKIYSCSNQPPRFTPFALNLVQSVYSLDANENSRLHFPEKESR